MTSILTALFGYWEVWHIVLASWLFMAVYFARFPFNYYWGLINRVPFKQLTLFTVMGIAIIWEVLEAQWNVKSYPNVKAFILNSYKDLLAALVGCLAGLLFTPKDRTK